MQSGLEPGTEGREVGAQRRVRVRSACRVFFAAGKQNSDSLKVESREALNRHPEAPAEGSRSARRALSDLSELPFYNNRNKSRARKDAAAGSFTPAASVQDDVLLHPDDRLLSRNVQTPGLGSVFLFPEKAPSVTGGVSARARRQPFSPRYLFP